jgi:hypothetical protein
MVTKVSWSAVRVRRRELAGYTTAQCMGSEEAAGDGDPDTESNVYVIQPYKIFSERCNGHPADMGKPSG